MVMFNHTQREKQLHVATGIGRKLSRGRRVERPAGRAISKGCQAKALRGERSKGWREGLGKQTPAEERKKGRRPGDDQVASIPPPPALALLIPQQAMSATCADRGERRHCHLEGRG